jgi:diguanylate cyclase (GGDEF)-like protein/PAS domain S-box-containing protein
MKNEKNIIPLHDRVRLIRIQTFFNNAAGNPFGLMGTGVLSVLILHGAGAPEAGMGGWLTLVFVVCTVTLLFERHVKRVGLANDNATRLYRIRIVLGGMVCALFGATVMFLPGLAPGMAHAFVFIITSSVVAVGYMAYAIEFIYCLMVNALTFMPFAVFCFYRYFNGGDSFFLLMGAAAIFWQVIVTGKALQVSRSAVGEIESRERLRDEIADRQLAQEALRASQQQSQRLAAMLRLMCDNVPDMIWAKDLEGRYTFANKALCENLLNSASTDEPLGKTFAYFAERERSRHPDDREWHTLGQYADDVERHTLSRDEPTIFEESGRVGGRFVFLDVHQARFINAQGEVIGTVGCARDITERKAAEALVQHLAHHDVLTDLPNRALLTDRLSQALAQARRDRIRLAVLFIDLDRLKPVNDTLGHEVGDLLLKEVGRRLRSVVTREADTVSRLGGDEFVVLLPRLNAEHDAAAMAEKILHTLNQTFSIDQHSITISASIGVAIFPQHGEDVDLLLRNADTAMYLAKHSGRNDYRIFDASVAGADGHSPRP